jgi:hypothetical protein
MSSVLMAQAPRNSPEQEVVVYHVNPVATPTQSSQTTSTTTTKNQDQALPMPLAKLNEDNQEEQGDEADNQELDNIKEINHLLLL